MFYTYILKCSDNTLYTGVAKDPIKRLVQHNIGKHGAKYTKARLPVELIYTEPHENRSQAQKREYQIKHLSKPEKLTLIDSNKSKDV